jgi:hypothetical protein
MFQSISEHVLDVSTSETCSYVVLFCDTIMPPRGVEAQGKARTVSQGGVQWTTQGLHLPVVKTEWINRSSFNLECRLSPRQGRVRKGDSTGALWAFSRK